jgi:DNA repair exonuclease SbcCD ATPase subunit
MQNQQNSGNKIFVVISAVLFVITLILGWQLYQQKTITNTIIVEKEKVESDYSTVKSEFEEIKMAYDELQTDNKQLKSELDARKEELEDLGVQLEKYKNDAAMVKKLRKELQTIRDLIKSYLHEIDSLQQANIGLKEQNKKVMNELQSEQNRSQQLTNEKEKLTEKVEVASKLKTYQLFADAVKVKGSDKESSTTKAKRADRIRACFTLSENKIAKKENKTIYMKVIAPGDEVLVTSTDDNNMFGVGNDRQYFSAKKDIFYENEAKEMCLAFTKKDKDEFKPGRYKIEIFADGAMIGNTSFELK